MMRFGVNQKRYPDMAPHVSGITIERTYKPLASTWPVMQVPAMPSLWSPRPNPATLLAGGYDAEFTAALKTAPPGSLLTTWHEADKGPNDPAGGLTAAVAREVHTYMHALVHKVTQDIPYGSVSTGGVHTGTWTVPGLDFYGVDSYDTDLKNHPMYHLNAWSGTQPPGPRVIAETNSSVEAHRPWWFQGCYEWLLANSGIALMTFWNPTGKLSGPWLNGDTATIAELNRISAAAAA